MRQALVRVALSALDNPLLLKELRGGFRRRRYVLLLSGFLALVGLAVVGTLVGVSEIDPVDPSRTGRQTFVAFFAVEAVLVLLAFPAFSCTSVVEERTHQSLDLLVTTRLSPAAIALGKLLAALVYGLTFIAATAPLVALTFLYGGITPGQIVFAYGALVVAAAVVTSYGLMVSTLTDTAARAVLRTFLLLPAVSAVALAPLAWLAWVVVAGPLLGERDAIQAREWLAGLDAVNRGLVYASAGAWTVGWMALFLVAAIDRLQPPRADRTSGLRGWFVVAWTVAVVLVAAAWVHNEPLPSGLAARTLTQALLVTLVVFVTATVALVGEPNREPYPPRQVGRLEPLRALLRPGAGRATALLALLAFGTGAALLGLTAGHLGDARSSELRTMAELATGAVPWVVVYLLALAQWALFLARRMGPIAARSLLGLSLLVTAGYPAVAYHLVPRPAEHTPSVLDAAFLSPWTSGCSAILEVSPFDRRLFLFGPSGQVVRERLNERVQDELRRHPGLARNQRWKGEFQAAYLAQVPGVPAHQLSIGFFAALAVLLLGIELRRRRRATAGGSAGSRPVTRPLAPPPASSSSCRRTPAGRPDSAPAPSRGETPEPA